MPANLPKPKKPAEQLRRRNAPEQWTVLPAEGCRLPVPKWPTGSPATVELALWKRLWALPVAAWWHEQGIEPSVVARYVELRFAKPGLAVLSRIEGELGLTPASLLRMRLTVERPEQKPARLPDPYLHLREEFGAA
jgi:hypothetical protein